jgi:hypothetical protein
MQKAHLYEAILSVNRGVDEAVQGLEQLKRIKDSGLDPACVDEKVTLFEIHRASSTATSATTSGGIRTGTRPDSSGSTASTRRTPWTRSKSIVTSGPSKGVGGWKASRPRYGCSPRRSSRNGSGSTRNRPKVWAAKPTAV